MVELAAAVSSAEPRGMDVWSVKSTHGKVYRVVLFWTPDGWYGSCECDCFRIAWTQTQKGNPVHPCKHLVYVRLNKTGLKRPLDAILWADEPPPSGQGAGPCDMPPKEAR